MRTVMSVSRATEALFKLGPGHACWPLKTWICVLYQRDYSRWGFFKNQFKFLLHFSVCVTISTMCVLGIGLVASTFTHRAISPDRGYDF